MIKNDVNKIRDKCPLNILSWHPPTKNEYSWHSWEGGKTVTYAVIILRKNKLEMQLISF